MLYLSSRTSEMYPARLRRCIEVVITRTTRNRLSGKTLRGFESHHLRQSWGISAAGSAPHWQCGGHGFESRMLHHFHDLESNVNALLSRFSILGKSLFVLYLSFIGSERRENAAFFMTKQIAILAKSRAQALSVIGISRRESRMPHCISYHKRNADATFM